MRVESKPIFSFFLSDYRIVEEKKRYDKLNDAAYSALKYRDCAANFFFNYSTWWLGDSRIGRRGEFPISTIDFWHGYFDTFL